MPGSQKKRWRVFLLGIFTVSVVFCSVMIELHGRGRLQFMREQFVVSGVRHNAGVAYEARLGRVWSHHWDRHRGVELREDSRRMGPSQSGLEDIRSLGGGRYLVSNDRLYFSTLGNEDPSSNGKRYTLQWFTPASARLRWASHLIAACLLGLWVFYNRRLVAKYFAPIGNRLPKLRVTFRGIWRRCLPRHSPSPATGDGPFRIAATVFLVTLALQWLNFHYRLNDLELAKYWFNVCGAPYTDGLSWITAAENLASGGGASGYMIFRPGYSWFLACFFTWASHTPALAILLNVILSALTSACIALIGMRVANAAVGIAAGLGFCLHQLTLDHVLCYSTETLGLFLFVLAVYYCLAALRRRAWHLVFLSGLVLALSNLTRPLTLSVAPAYAVTCLLLRRVDGASWRSAGLFASALLLGVFITVGPWVVRQRLTHGIWALAPNSADGLFAATSPKYRFWTTDIYHDNAADLAGLKTVKERYDYFNRGTMEHLAANPGFYVRNVAGTYLRTLGAFTIFAPTPLIAVLLTLVCHFPLAAVYWRRRQSIAAWSGLLASACFFSVLQVLLPPPCKIFIACALLVLLPFISRTRLFALLLVTAVFGVLGSALFGLIFARTNYMLEWVFLLGYLQGLHIAISAAAAWWLPKTTGLPFNVPSVCTSAGPPPLWFHYTRIAVILFFAVSAVRIAVLQAMFPPAPPTVPPVVTVSETAAIIAELRRLHPSLVSPADAKDGPLINGFLTDLRAQEDTKLVFLSGAVNGFFHRIPAGRTVPYTYRSMSFRCFARRDYDRTFFFFANGPWPQVLGGLPVTFPGFLPDSLLRREYVLVCRLRNARQVHPDNQIFLEGLAFIPRDPVNRTLRFDDTIPADDPRHLWYATAPIDDVLATEGAIYKVE
jgi:hypothetical protein